MHKKRSFTESKLNSLICIIVDLFCVFISLVDQVEVAGTSGEPAKGDNPGTSQPQTAENVASSNLAPLDAIQIPVGAVSIKVPTEYNSAREKFYRCLKRMTIEPPGGATVDFCRTLRSMLKESYDEFSQKYREFVVFVAGGNSGFDQQVELLNSHKTSAEDAYLEAESGMSRRIRRHDERMKSAAPVMAPVTVNLPIDPANVANTWGVFDGNPLSWHGFISAFRAAVHDRAAIPPVNKFKYLLKALKGPAAHAIGSWDITSENYSSAFERLLVLYNKKYPRVRAYIAEIRSLPALRNTTAEGLQKMANTTYEVTRQLKALGVPTDSWDLWLVCELHSKMDPDTCCEWELTRNDDDNPRLSTMLRFLERRAAAYSNIASAGQASHGSWTNRNPILSTSQAAAQAAGPSSAGAANQGTGKKRHMCYPCQTEHQVYQCPKFTVLSLERCQRYVRDKKLCPNCLRVGGHALDDCRFGGCFVCPGNPKHNPLLCPQRELQKNPVSVAVSATKRPAKSKED